MVLLGTRNNYGDNLMPTNIPLEERLGIIHEITLAIGDSSHRTEDGFRSDFFCLIMAIARDHMISCTCRQRLFGELRRTAAWPRVRPFLEYSDSRCSTTKCYHGKEYHTGPGGACLGRHGGYVINAIGRFEWKYSPCQCIKFHQKDFK